MMPASYREVLSATPKSVRLRITFAASSQDDFVAQSLLEGIKTQIDNKYPDIPDRHLDGIRNAGVSEVKERKTTRKRKCRDRMVLSARNEERIVRGTHEVRFGGAHVQPDLFCPTIRVPLRTT